MAPCQVHIDTSDVIVHVRLSGTLEYGNNADVSQKVNRLFEQGHTKVIIDLSAVDFTNSHGLGALVSIMTASETHGAEFLLLNPSAKTEQVLTVTKLISKFRIHKGNLESAKRELAG